MRGGERSERETKFLIIKSNEFWHVLFCRVLKKLGAKQFFRLCDNLSLHFNNNRLSAHSILFERRDSNKGGSYVKTIHRTSRRNCRACCLFLARFSILLFLRRPIIKDVPETWEAGQVSFKTFTVVSTNATLPRRP